MSKYLSAEIWKPSDSFKSSDTAETIIREKQKNVSILAGPGSGKTEILAQRASFLLETGTCKAPQKILALSFKIDAASNIRKRVNLRCGNELSRRFEASTFDAFFISLVRRFASLLPDWVNIPPDFDVYPFDRNWWNHYEQTELNGQPCQYKSTFARSDLHSPLDLSKAPVNEILRIWDYCRKNKIADYAMCRSMAFTIIKNNIQVRNLILSTYKYLFLDEFQDTTDPQYGFVNTIFKGSDTLITAVGDSNQMIMGWAGANLKNFENLGRDFNTDLINLAINHRSNSKIVDLINHVINDLTPPNEIPVIYEGTRKDKPPPYCLGVKSFDSPEAEVNYISKYISSIMQENTTLIPSDFALILRQRADIYFALATNAFNDCGISLRNEDAFVVENGVKIQDLMAEPICIFFILIIRRKTGFIDYSEEKELERMASMFTGLNCDVDRDYKKLKKYITDLVSCFELNCPIEDATTKMLEVIGDAEIKAIFPQYRSSHLDKVKKSFCILFQDALAKYPNDINQAIDIYEGVSQVKLMTIHKSKGLEFDTVFFVDFNDESWWGLKRAVQNNNVQQQREEKNSFFVGISRAEERLFFTKHRGNWPPVITNVLSDSKLIVKLPDL